MTMSLELSDNERTVLENALTHYFDHMEEDDEDEPVVVLLLARLGH